MFNRENAKANQTILTIRYSNTYTHEGAQGIDEFHQKLDLLKQLRIKLKMRVTNDIFPIEPKANTPPFSFIPNTQEQPI